MNFDTIDQAVSFFGGSRKPGGEPIAWLAWFNPFGWGGHWVACADEATARKHKSSVTTIYAA